MKRHQIVWKKYVWLMSLMMLTGCTSTIGVRCDERLSQINAPASAHKHEEAATSGMTTQEVEP